MNYTNSFNNRLFSKLMLMYVVVFGLQIITMMPAKAQYLGEKTEAFPEKHIQVFHLEAHIQIDTLSRTLTAETELHFRTIRTDIDSVVIQAPNFRFDLVLLNGNKPNYYQSGENLVLKLPRPRKTGDNYKLQLNYKVQPATELYFTGFDDNSFSMKRQIWAHRPHNWLPYVPGRITQDLYITFSSRYQVFSNGIRESVQKHKNGTSTWHYSMKKDHPFFSMALVIGDYRWKNFTSSSGVPVELWYYPEREHELEATYMLMDEMLQFCETEFGVPYPYELYRQAPVADYLFGGMETTTSTIFGDYMHIDGRAFWERNYVNVNIHELVHQWFGNYISHLRTSDVWLTESFASFYAKLFEYEYFGEGQYLWERQKELTRSFSAAENNRYGLGNRRGGSDRWYAKGSLVLDMLRDELGKNDFRRVIKHYLEHNGFSEVWTYDMLKAIYDVTGRDFTKFFNQWIIHGGEPHYRIRSEDHQSHMLMHIEQIQPIDSIHPPFSNKLVFEAFFQEGSRERHEFQNDQKEQWIVIPKDPTMLYLLFDPGQRLIKKYEWERDKYTRLDQFLNTAFLADRLDALVSLRDVPTDDKLMFYYDFAERHAYHLLREEVLQQISKDTSHMAIELFRQSLNDAEVMVRRAALKKLQPHHHVLLSDIEACLQDTSYSNIILALDQLYALAPKNIDAYLKKTENVIGFPGKNVRIHSLKTAVAAGKTKNLKELIDYVSNKYDFSTRINAIQALQNLNYLDQTSARLLVQASKHWNIKLNKAAKEAIEFYSTQPKFNAMIKAVN